jgi:hypothetical protein
MGLGQRSLPLPPLSSSPPNFHQCSLNDNIVMDLHPHLHRLSFPRISSSSSSKSVPHVSSLCKSALCRSISHNNTLNPHTQQKILSTDIVKVRLCRSVSESRPKQRASDSHSVGTSSVVSTSSQVKDRICVKGVDTIPVNKGLSSLVWSKILERV